MHLSRIVPQQSVTKQLAFSYKRKMKVSCLLVYTCTVHSITKMILFDSYRHKEIDIQKEQISLLKPLKVIYLSYNIAVIQLVMNVL